MEDYQIIVTDFAVLFTVCCVYAVIVNRARAWYIKRNKTWFMLVVGVCIVLSALAALIPYHIIALDQWGLMILAFCVGGAPMVVGQLIQDAHDRGQGERRNHDESSRR